MNSEQKYDYYDKYWEVFANSTYLENLDLLNPLTTDEDTPLILSDFVFNSSLNDVSPREFALFNLSLPDGFDCLIKDENAGNKYHKHIRNIAELELKNGNAGVAPSRGEVVQYIESIVTQEKQSIKESLDKFKALEFSHLYHYGSTFYKLDLGAYIKQLTEFEVKNRSILNIELISIALHNGVKFEENIVSYWMDMLNEDIHCNKVFVAFGEYQVPKQKRTLKEEQALKLYKLLMKHRLVKNNYHMLWQWVGCSDHLLAYLILRLRDIGYIPVAEYHFWKTMSFYIKQKGRQNLRQIYNGNQYQESLPKDYHLIDEIINKLN